VIQEALEKRSPDHRLDASLSRSAIVTNTPAPSSRPAVFYNGDEVVDGGWII